MLSDNEPDDDDGVSLKPCPVPSCGAFAQQAIDGWIETRHQPGTFYVRCSRCGACGPRVRTNDADARAMWNSMPRVAADDDDPVTIKRLEAIGFDEPSLNGMSILIPAPRMVDPVELVLNPFVGNKDYGQAFLLQSNNNDHVLLAGRYSRMGQVRRLLAALKGK